MTRTLALATSALISVALAACSFDTPKLDKQQDGATSQTRGNHRAQVARARATAAKAKAVAEAELSVYPLVEFLGSPRQRAARAAEAHLEALTVHPATGSTSAMAMAKPHQIGPATLRTALRRPQGRAKLKIPARTVAAARSEYISPTPRPTALLRRPTIKTRAVMDVVYDVASSIKTVHMSDGSVEETLFDAAELPLVESPAAAGKARITILNREAPPIAGPAEKPAFEGR